MPTIQNKLVPRPYTHLRCLIFTLILFFHLHLEREPHPSGFSPRLFCALRISTNSATYLVHLIPDLID